MEFIKLSYDGDLDHELYFGGELLQGRLIWSAEFHDKLPGLQMLFSLVALGGDIAYWRFLTLFAVLCTVLVALKNFPILLSSDRRREPTYVAIVAAIFFLLLLPQVPGGLTHINVAAASCAMAATILGCRFCRNEWIPSRPGLTIFGLSIFSAVSISIRPYFALPIALILIFILVNFLQGSENKSRLRVRSALAATVAPPMLTFFVNVAPYALTGQMSAFESGIKFLSETNVPRPAWGGFLQTIPNIPTLWTPSSLYIFGVGIWMPILLAISTLMVITWFFRFKHNPFIAFYLPTGVVSLFLAIMSEHWWPHYAALFGWYGAVFFAYLLVRVWGLKSPSSRPKSLLARLLATSSLVIPALIAAVAVILFLANYQKNVIERGFESREANAAFYKNYMEAQFETHPSFLAPGNMYLHFKMREPRHGFPHASNSQHIAEGWWNLSSTNGKFLAPTTIEEYCGEISRADFDLLILEESSPFLKCGLHSTPWSLDIHSIAIDESGQLVYFVVRR